MWLNLNPSFWFTVCLETASLWIPGVNTHPGRNSRVGLPLENFYKEIDEKKRRGRKPRIMHECFIWLCDIAEDDVWCFSRPRWIGPVHRKYGISLGPHGSGSTKVAYPWT